MELHLIEGTVEEKIQERTLRYAVAFRNALTVKKEDQQNKNIVHSALMKAALMGVKMIASEKDKKYTFKKELESDLEIICVIKEMMAQMTPKEFMQYFPISKIYYKHGMDLEWKDYMFIKAKMDKYDQNKPLGDKIDNVLWDYLNYDIEMFMLQTLHVASTIRRTEGKMGIMEQWASDNNIPTYTLNEDAGYFMDNTTHKTVPYKKSVPRHSHLRIVQ